MGGRQIRVLQQLGGKYARAGQLAMIGQVRQRTA